MGDFMFSFCSNFVAESHLCFFWTHPQAHALAWITMLVEGECVWAGKLQWYANGLHKKKWLEKWNV